MPNVDIHCIGERSMGAIMCTTGSSNAGTVSTTLTHITPATILPSNVAMYANTMLSGVSGPMGSHPHSAITAYSTVPTDMAHMAAAAAPEALSACKFAVVTMVGWQTKANVMMDRHWSTRMRSSNSGHAGPGTVACTQ
ncbi:hypothetical protein ORF002R [Spotted knifejaw iridovirus]|nr:hypothetical protein ORF002R [Spotted knifejaw iridovirus]